MPQSSWQRGVIIGMDGGGRVEFQWNPQTVQITKSPNWNKLPSAGRERPHIQYGCGESVRYSFDMDLSRSDKGNDWVKSQTEKLIQLCKPTVKGAGVDRPPRVRLLLGQAISAQCVIESVTGTYGPLYNPQSLLPYDGKIHLELMESD